MSQATAYQGSVSEIFAYRPSFTVILIGLLIEPPFKSLGRSATAEHLYSGLTIQPPSRFHEKL